MFRSLTLFYVFSRIEQILVNVLWIVRVRFFIVGERSYERKRERKEWTLWCWVGGVWSRGSHSEKVISGKSVYSFGYLSVFIKQIQEWMNKNETRRKTVNKYETFPYRVWRSTCRIPAAQVRFACLAVILLWREP